jgi:hypothetical protein
MTFLDYGHAETRMPHALSSVTQGAASVFLLRFVLPGRSLTWRDPAMRCCDNLLCKRVQVASLHAWMSLAHDGRTWSGVSELMVRCKSRRWFFVIIIPAFSAALHSEKVLSVTTFPITSSNHRYASQVVAAPDSMYIA